MTARYKLKLIWYGQVRHFEVTVNSSVPVSTYFSFFSCFLPLSLHLSLGNTFLHKLYGSHGHEILHTQLWQWHLAHIRASMFKCTCTQTDTSALWTDRRSDRERVEKKTRQNEIIKSAHFSSVSQHSLSLALVYRQSGITQTDIQTEQRESGDSGRKEDERAHFSSCPGTAENICGIFLLLVRHMRHIHTK